MQPLSLRSGQEKTVKMTAFAVVFTAVSIFLAASAPALALDDGQESIFSALIGLTGLGTKKNDVEIDYRDRAPLVLPPKAQALRQPLEPGGQRTAAWPQDPDVARRAKQAKEAKAPVGTSQFDSPELSKAELLAGRAVNPNAAPPPSATEVYGSAVWVNPDVLRSQSRSVKKDDTSNLIVGVEPQRDKLTQPPPGYRKPTKDVKVTLSNPNKESDEASPYSFVRKLNPWASEDD